MIRRTLITAAATALVSTPAFAEIPPDVQAMIDAAIATGDAAKVETVVALAKQTQPDSAAEIEQIALAWRADQAEAHDTTAKKAVPDKVLAEDPGATTSSALRAALSMLGKK